MKCILFQYGRKSKWNNLECHWKTLRRNFHKTTINSNFSFSKQNNLFALLIIKHKRHKIVLFLKIDRILQQKTTKKKVKSA